jgi:thioredoxin 1
MWVVTSRKSREDRAEHWMRPLAAVAGLLTCAVLALLATGCAASNIHEIKDIEDFQNVLISETPVMVDFYKGGCPTCVALEPTLNELAAEYKGKIIFARFKLMEPYFKVTSEELRKKYDVAYYPTEVLFVKGEEKKRWVLEYNKDKYTAVLNEVAGAPTPQEPAPKGGAAAHPAAPASPAAPIPPAAPASGAPKP